MEQLTEQTELIIKETIPFLFFPKGEILETSQQRTERQVAIDKAMRAGNLQKGKVSIIFEDNQGQKQVITTVWGITNTHLLLKGSILIPINRIKEVRFH